MASSPLLLFPQAIPTAPYEQTKRKQTEHVRLAWLEADSCFLHEHRV